MLTQRGPVLLAMTIVLAALLSAIGATALIAAVRPPAPLVYDQPYYIADDAALCPGDVLVWTPTLTVRDAGLITIVRTYWDVANDRAAQTKDGMTLVSIEASRVLPAHLAGKPRANTVRLIVPDLPPGAYVVSTSARGVGTEQAVYGVFFSVLSTC